MSYFESMFPIPENRRNADDMGMPPAVNRFEYCKGAGIDPENLTAPKDVPCPECGISSSALAPAETEEQ